jgi:hypothetical protein
MPIHSVTIGNFKGIEPIKIDGNGEIYHDWKQGFCD